MAAAISERNTMKTKRSKLLNRTTITIELEWKDEGDKELALEEAVSKIGQGYFSGFDSNDDGSYSFTVREDEA
jgi:hypothetical protein